ncbi:MAG TPA: D-glucuronyl C5-epimerase family protein [Solirubrobacteraceae bacterium]|nr:D-glucuronyl C5-epimerase family protein [Solirubrobacteraceae bacterium]
MQFAARVVKWAARAADDVRVPRLRTLALLVVLAVALVGLRAPLGAPPVAPPRAAAAPPVALAEARDPDVDGARARAAERRRRAADRRAEARRLRRSRSVRGALRRAWLARAISRRRYESLRHMWWRANRDVRRLSGTRRAELAAVLGMAERLARARILTVGRLDAVFLTIRRNRELWTGRPLPRPGARMTFGGDPVVFEYYSGRGLAIQPLASFGRANALAAQCLRRSSRYRCRPRALRRLLRRMVALGSERGGFLAWEYLVPFGGGAPPWISAMTQATGAQALARGRRALGDRRFARAARRALGAFDRSPPLGVAVRSRHGVRYAMYSFARRLRIYNGELQALIGLRDVARILHSRRAQRLYLRGEPLARRSVRALDTGAWSLYSEGGAESTLGYHRLVAGFLDGLCSRTGRRTYCAGGRRLARYVREPPRVRVRSAPKLRARRRTAITLELSKISDVTLQVRDRRGRIELSRGLRLPRGRHRVAWVPTLVGRHTVRVVAVGPAGRRTVVGQTLNAESPRSRRARAKAKERAKAKAKERAKAKAGEKRRPAGY